MHTRVDPCMVTLFLRWSQPTYGEVSVELTLQRVVLPSHSSRRRHSRSGVQHGALVSQRTLRATVAGVCVSLEISGLRVQKSHVTEGGVVFCLPSPGSKNGTTCAVCLETLSSPQKYFGAALFLRTKYHIDR